MSARTQTIITPRTKTPRITKPIMSYMPIFFHSFPFGLQKSFEDFHNLTGFICVAPLGAVGFFIVEQYAVCELNRLALGSSVGDYCDFVPPYARQVLSQPSDFGIGYNLAVCFITAFA